jgi:hypothetical protein
VFGLLTPYPATTLYDKLAAANRLTRPKHWLDFKPFVMAHTPKGISSEQAEAEVRRAWRVSYEPATNASAIARVTESRLSDRIVHLAARLLFRGIYFPQMRRREWLRVCFENRGSFFSLISAALSAKFRMRTESDRALPAIQPVPPA